MKARLAALIATSSILSGCGFVHDERVDGPYRLVAVDTEDQMTICYGLENGNCIGRIPATVFQAGFDNQYVVGASHLGASKGSVSYFYVVRAVDGPLVDPSVSVRGPFNATEFAEERSRLGLPDLKPVD